MPWLLLLATGLGGFGAQVVLMRQVLATLGGNEFAVALALAAWMLWEAAGSLVGRTRAAARLAGWLAFAAPLVSLAASAAAVPVRRILGAVPGSELSPPLLAVAVIGLSALPALAWSALFVTAIGSGRADTAPGRAYAWRGAGTAAGAVLSVLLFRFGVPPLAVGCLLCLPLCLAVRPALLAPVLAVLLIVAAAFGNQAERLLWRLAWPGQSALAVADSPYGKTVTLAREGERTVLYDGAPVAAAPALPSLIAEELALVPLLSAPEPDRVLIVGSGFGPVARAALLVPHTLVTVAHPDSVLVAAVRGLDDSLCYDRLAGVEQAADSSFDCIILTDAVPATLAAGRFRSRRFYADCRRRLGPGGLLAIGGPGDPTGLSPDAAALLRSTRQDLAVEFASVRLLALDFPLLLAGSGPALPDETLVTRAGRLRPGALLDTSYLGALLDRLRQERLAAAVAAAPADRPVLFAALLREGRLASPGFARWYGRIAGLQYWQCWLGLVMLAAGALALGRRPGRRRDWAIATSGAAGAALPVLVMFAWQLRFGSLYSGFALIAGALLAGAALGGLVPLRLGADLFLVVGDITLVVMAAALVALERAGPAAGFILLNLVAGLALGVQYAAASAGADVAARRAGRTAALDLGGGALGAPAAALVLVPLFGVAAAALLVAGLKFASALGLAAGLLFDSRSHHT